MARARRLMLIVLLFLPAIFVRAQNVPPTDERSPSAQLAHAIKTLAAEAQQSLDEQRLVRAAADFANDFNADLPTDMLAQKLARPQHRDDFIDAYIRWQLTSFTSAAFDFETMKDGAFDALLRDLPDLIENPRADERLIVALNRAQQAGTLSPAAEETINKDLNALAERTSLANDFSRPALEFREWLAKQLPARGAADRLVLLDLERCVALVAAGWGAGEAKNRIERDLQTASGAYDFTPEQRRRVVRAAEALSGRNRSLVASAGVQERTLTVEYTQTGIFDYEVRRWSKIALGQDEN